MSTIRLSKDTNLVKFVQTVYIMSQPVGMGYMHYVDEPLSELDAIGLINMHAKRPIQMDYVKGRCCKMTVHKDEDGLFIRDYWGDHSIEQLEHLLKVSNHVY
jgi:hypothetical protein